MPTRWGMLRTGGSGWSTTNTSLSPIAASVPRGKGLPLVLRGGRAVASWSHRFEGTRMVVKVAPFERRPKDATLYEHVFDGVGKLLGATSVEVDTTTSSN